MGDVLTVILWVLLGLVGLALVLVIAVAFLLYFVVYARNIPKYGTLLLGDNMTSDMSDPVEVNRVNWAKETETYVENHEPEELHTLSFDGLKLYGRLLKGDPECKRVVILVHGYHSSSTMDFGNVVQFYHVKGYHVFLPDNRAHGQSEGKLLGFGWLDRRDVITWCKKLIRRFTPDCEIILSGVSMGAAAVMMASGEKDLPKQVRLIIEDCGFTGAIPQFEYMFPQQVRFLAKPVLFFDNLISLIFNRHSIYKASSVKQVALTDRPMLFIHGEEDTFVPTDMVYENYDACNAPKKILIMPNAHHAQSCNADFERYTATVDQFIQEVLGS
ncbi:MAG: alpha/beta hydrolase [Lachnospiraceae bacterium]|nr:alpha/beta hydrolase [Lachnospiraceae bacterium]